MRMRLPGEEEEEEGKKRKRGPKEEGGGGGEEEDGAPEAPERKKRAKPYRRHPKPPFSYLALIALVIQAAPQKRLRLNQILSEIERLFPLFSGDYQGWKDSVRHNLSSNPCFFKEESGTRKGKRNFWQVDVARIPARLLKRQNTPRGRPGGQEPGAPFIPDLAPFVLQGEPYPPGPQKGPSAKGGRAPKKELPSVPPPRGASFRIEELVPKVARKASLGGEQSGLDLGQEEAPPLLYAPPLPPSYYWHCPPTHYGLGVGAAFHLPNAFYPLPSPCGGCLDPACPLTPTSPSPALALGLPMGPQFCCPFYPPVPGWPPY